jgi:hypothetical protein
MSRALLAWTCACACAIPAVAQAQRPDEESMFGAPEAAPETQPESPAGEPEAPAAPGDREAEVFGGPGIQDAFESGAEAVDPLKIGGQFYLRTQAQGGRGVAFLDTRISSPMLVDGYFDARPNDRVRGLVVGRLSYDPTFKPVDVTQPDAEGDFNFGAISAALNGASQGNPSVLLDQAWVRFDIARTVFVTVGKQHVKWGTSRIWNPTDYLSPTTRDPLQPFDARLGAWMVKAHVPWEKEGWNFYAMGLLDNAGPASLFRELGGALRAEAVLFKTAEVGLAALFQQGRKPKYAMDFSMPLGPVDVYGELALKQGSDVPRFRCAGDQRPCVSEQPETLQAYRSLFEPDPTEGWRPAASGGLTWTFAYSENDTATVGLEYFYNSNGYEDSTIYPLLLFQGGFTPFYLGKHYAALYAVLLGPGSWDKTTFFLYNLGNLSDQSYVSRLNFGVQVHSYLQIEAFAALHYGRLGGEFRMGIDTRGVQGIYDFHVPVPAWQTGAGLRINL